MKALIQGNRVAQVCEQAFEVHASLIWVDAPEGCVAGWTYENGQFIPLPPPPERTYAEKRQREYPAIGDQLDALFHAGVFPAEMADKIQAIKNKYPKGGA